METQEKAKQVEFFQNEDCIVFTEGENPQKTEFFIVEGHEDFEVEIKKYDDINDYLEDRPFHCHMFTPEMAGSYIDGSLIQEAIDDNDLGTNKWGTGYIMRVRDFSDSVIKFLVEVRTEELTELYIFDKENLEEASSFMRERLEEVTSVNP